MGLKFRRGSTAQQSGSLAFGEPYVNTTLGTLVVGGATGDIVLSAGGTGSTGNFGAISGSGLDITGNANIAGNLTLGGAITIGDATADTVNVVASLSSSLIPQTTNAFDLGSATKIWRDLYISTGSIKFVEGTSVVKSLSAATLTALEAATGSANVSVAALNSFTSSQLTQNTALATISGSLILTASANSVSVANLNSFSSSQLTQNTALATISGSLIASASAAKTTNDSQDVSVSNLNTFSGSANTRFTEIGVVSGSLITSASAAKTTNDSQGVSITNLNSATASLMIETANLETFSSSALTRLDNLEGKDISITLTGDVTGTGTITNLANVSFATTIAADSVALGTDTTGNYVASLVAGTNITLSNNSGEGATPTIGLTNNSTTIGTTAISLGSSSTTLAGLTSVTSTAFVGALTGNASTATTLATARAINGVNFDGSAAITVTAAAGTLSGATLASGVTASSLTSVGTLTTLTVSGATATGALTVTGAITATGDITAFYTSDKRHKNNIQTIPNALEKVTKLNGVTWEWNDDVNEVTKSTPKTGLIAQEVQEVLPEVVKTRDDGFLALDYSKMMGLMVEAIKEQQIQIEELKAQIGSK